jgi:hypothetical protein
MAVLPFPSASPTPLLLIQSSSAGGDAVLGMCVHDVSADSLVSLVPVTPFPRYLQTHKRLVSMTASVEA